MRSFAGPFAAGSWCSRCPGRWHSARRQHAARSDSYQPVDPTYLYLSGSLAGPQLGPDRGGNIIRVAFRLKYLRASEQIVSGAVLRPPSHHPTRRPRCGGGVSECILLLRSAHLGEASSVESNCSYSRSYANLPKHRLCR